VLTDYGAGVTQPTEAPGPAAGFGRRLVALVIDWFVSLGVTLLVFREVSYGSAASSFATLAVFAGEVIVFTWLLAGSFGQLLLRLRVVRVEGGRLGLGRIILRTVLLCLVIPAVIWDSSGRGLHDRAAGSIVVRAGSRT
jgi:uncharacterized RDD family membrane protein YckC